MLGFQLFPELVARVYCAAQPVVGSLQALADVLQSCLQLLDLCVSLSAAVLESLNHLVLRRVKNGSSCLPALQDRPAAGYGCNDVAFHNALFVSCKDAQERLLWSDRTCSADADTS